MNSKQKPVATKAATPPTPPPAPMPSSQPNSASVPISLYREVAADLQSSRASLNSLQVRNRELEQKNQQLRLEIERVVQTALHLRQVADGQPVNQAVELEIFADEPEVSAKEQSVRTSLEAVPGRLTPIAGAPGQLSADTVVIEQDSKPRSLAKPEAPADVNTWWLVAVICLIVLTAFGTGFLLVRPLLPSR